MGVEQILKQFVIFATMLQKPLPKRHSRVRISALLICLSAFLLGQYQQQIGHQLAHSHEQEKHHSPEQEADACHVSIFHAGAASACSHPTHLSHYHQDCDWCDAFLNSFWPSGDVQFRAVANSLATKKFAYTPLTDKVRWVRTRNRAPPLG